MTEQRAKSTPQQCAACDPVSVREMFEKELIYRKDAFDTAMKNLKEQTALHFKLLEVAHNKSEEVLNDRLGRMNEFREAMKDQTANFISRHEIALLMEPVHSDLQALRELSAEAKGKASVTSVYLSHILAVVAVVISLYATLT